MLRNIPPRSRFRAGALAGLLVLAAFAAPLNSARAVERPFLAGDWTGVVAALADNGPQTVFERIALGHANLALNDLNAALCRFLDAGQDDLAALRAATGDLVARHGDAAMAQFARGDALARSKMFVEATAAFDRALRIAPNTAIILNARSATHAALGDWETASIDAYAAIEADPGLADAHATLGMLYVQRREAPRGAIRAFEAALERSPGSALALNGRGAARAAQGEWDLANTDFAAAIGETECAVVADLNRLQLASKRLAAEQANSEMVLASAAPGTSMQIQAVNTLKKIEPLRSITDGQLSSAFDLVRHSPEAQAGGLLRKNSADLASVTGAIKPRMFAQAISEPANVAAALIKHPVASASLSVVSSGAGAIAAGFGATIDNANARIGGRFEQVRDLHSNFGKLDARIGAVISGAPRHCCVDAGGVRTSNPRNFIDAGAWGVVTWPGLAYAVLPAAR